MILHRRLLRALCLAALTFRPAVVDGQTPAPAPPHQHAPSPALPAPADDDHSAHQMPDASLPSFIPPVSDADRAAAFPDVMGHSVHDNPVNAFVLFDQLEWQSGTGGRALSLDTRGWIGTDRHRFWFRAEGEGTQGALESGQAHALYGRAVARWWTVVAGLRQDVAPGAAETWAAVGLQGLAPYWFEVEATAYVSAAGRTQMRLETEYELLVTNRLILQPLVEADLYGRGDPARGLGAGLSSIEAGLRLRYEIRREIAPYVGMVWQWRLFGTAAAARLDGQAVRGARLAVGLRLWR